ncbi:hypothetical protein [Campylobacter vulpis]|uniref:hypothetical protein n=1 Tax=Campylobacter vulpis TaxID=1655500 RepID=UPI000C15F009|nr:hypothetical protein [Campylobacter vulpis]MBS4275605.1 hypothetical protein [Campylobacter vulpis]MBS4306812.1 hypothetical protein [Campylobacter vulpis]MBS4329920.1 hypothetical protein [Campylobacter vulpis]MBS4423567.1 hypothetical protein [Campylobacter vulpis]PHY89910.1 hypothetical protein AA995_07165 [Campylobacter vulpis]
MFLNYVFNDYKQKMSCDKCAKTALKSLIFNFNMDKNPALKQQVKEANYNGVIEFKPLCIGCELLMENALKVEITHKEITGIFLKVRAV